MSRPKAEELVSFFQKNDPALSKLANSIGELPDRRVEDPYLSLVDAIVSQQISTAAAANIFKRLKSRFGGVLEPGVLRNLDLEEFRECGVSRQKAGYIISISEHFQDRSDEMERLPEMSDAEVVSALTQIKGIGEWTAQMFLMFTLSRPDVFPVKDFAIRKAMHQLYGWKSERKHSTLINKAKKWQPYRSYACLYLWQSLH